MFQRPEPRDRSTAHAFCHHVRLGTQLVSEAGRGLVAEILAIRRGLHRVGWHDDRRPRASGSIIGGRGNRPADAAQSEANATTPPAVPGRAQPALRSQREDGQRGWNCAAGLRPWSVRVRPADGHLADDPVPAPPSRCVRSRLPCLGSGRMANVGRPHPAGRPPRC